MDDNEEDALPHPSAFMAQASTPSIPQSLSLQDRYEGPFAFEPGTRSARMHVESSPVHILPETLTLITAMTTNSTMGNIAAAQTTALEVGAPTATLSNSTRQELVAKTCVSDPIYQDGPFMGASRDELAHYHEAQLPQQRPLHYAQHHSSVQQRSLPALNVHSLNYEQFKVGMPQESEYEVFDQQEFAHQQHQLRSYLQQCLEQRDRTTTIDNDRGSSSSSSSSSTGQCSSKEDPMTTLRSVLTPESVSEPPKTSRVRKASLGQREITKKKATGRSRGGKKDHEEEEDTDHKCQVGSASSMAIAGPATNAAGSVRTTSGSSTTPEPSDPASTILWTSRDDELLVHAVLDAIEEKRIPWTKISRGLRFEKISPKPDACRSRFMHLARSRLLPNSASEEV